MSNYSYVAIDVQGMEMRGSLEVPNQSEALRRIKEMGLFATKVVELNKARGRVVRSKSVRTGLRRGFSWPLGRIKPRIMATFTRQLATLVEAGMPLMRGLRLLQEQAETRRLRTTIEELCANIENGSSLAEALALQPRVFNRLYVNMVKAGEVGGALEVALARLADFMEKAQRIKGKVKAAMFYPCAVIVVAVGIMTLLMTYVLPKFKEVFEGLNNGVPLPAFTRFVLALSENIKSHFILGAGMVVGVIGGITLLLQTKAGRSVFDRLKLRMPLLGPVFKKVAISRFSRTLGTLASSGVPILQALKIVKETAGNVAVGSVIATMHDKVEEGDPMAPALKSSWVFPALVAGMVDVGEQTGALPEMLLKIADNYDNEVDDSVNAMTSLLEPIMIVFLAVVVGSIVIAMFLPICTFGDKPFDGNRTE